MLQGTWLVSCWLNQLLGHKVHLGLGDWLDSSTSNTSTQTIGLYLLKLSHSANKIQISWSLGERNWNRACILECFHPLYWKSVNLCFTEIHHWSSNVCVPGYKRGHFPLTILCCSPTVLSVVGPSSDIKLSLVDYVRIFGCLLSHVNSVPKWEHLTWNRRVSTSVIHNVESAPMSYQPIISISSLYLTTSSSIQLVSSHTSSSSVSLTQIHPFSLRPFYWYTGLHSLPAVLPFLLLLLYFLIHSPIAPHLPGPKLHWHSS